MRRAYALPAPAEPPLMSALNTTPLIDVLLVLLIMFILAVPAATHRVAVDLPRADAGHAMPSVPHRLAINRAGAVTLDGVAVADAALPARLRGVAADTRAVLHFAPDPYVRYARVDAVLAEVKRAGIERLGIVG